VSIPVIVEPVPVEVNNTIALAQVRDVEVAIAVANEYIARHPYHRPLNTLGVE